MNTTAKNLLLCKPTERKPFGKHMLAALSRALLNFALIVGAFFAVQQFSTGTVVHAEPDAPIEITQISEGEELLTEYDDSCWTAEETKLVDIPGSAIITFADDSAVVTTDVKNVTAAWSEVLASLGFDEPTTDKFDVVALCV